MHALWGLRRPCELPKFPAPGSVRRREAVAYSRATSSIRRDSMPATPDQVHIFQSHQRSTLSTARFFIYPSRGCVPSQQSILPPLRNVIPNWRLGTLAGRCSSVVGVWGCQMLLRDSRLPLVFQGTAAKPLARRIPAGLRHCRPTGQRRVVDKS